MNQTENEKKTNGSEQTLSELEKMALEARELEETDARAVAAAREKKRLRKKKARRRKILIVLVLLLAAAAALAAVLYQKKKAQEEENKTLEIQADEGQEIVYAEITEICGNEITYTLLRQTEMPTPAEGGSRGQMPMSPSEEAGASFAEESFLQIPVGTDVITRLGNTTTFSRLGSGDVIAMIKEDDDVVRIYLMR